MKETGKIFVFYLIAIFILVFCCSKCNGQTVVTDTTFESTQKGLSLVEFWAEWNEKHECDWITEIEDVKSYRITVDSESAKKYKITVLPTIILFSDGKEIERYEGDVSFHLCPINTAEQINQTIQQLEE